jgi:hypothetical protein
MDRGKDPFQNQKENSMPWTIRHTEDPDTGDFTAKTTFPTLKEAIEFGFIEVTKDDFGNIGGAIRVPAFPDWFPQSITRKPSLKSLLGAKPDGFTAEAWETEAQMALDYW